MGLTTAGTAIELKDTVNSGGNLSVNALNSSTAAADLGILGTGTGATLTGLAISDGSTDIRVTLTNGKIVDIDLSPALTIQDVLDAITAAHANLSATLNATATAMTSASSAST